MGKNDHLPQFCKTRQLQAYAKRRGISLREGVDELTAHDVWPEQFRRNLKLISPQSQRKLLDLPIFVAGCGGLGGEMAAHLAQLGCGRLTLCDCDRFEESNLNRQRFCDASSLGEAKAAVTAEKLRQKVPWGIYEPLETKLTAENAPGLLNGSAIVIDCLDSVPGKKMLEKAAERAACVWLHGAVLENEGFVCLKTKPGGVLEGLYGDASESGAGAILTHVVAGAAALMASLFLKWLEDPGFESSLLHADFSIPEIERFELS